MLQAEDALNAFVTHPLPRAFYEQGGMQKLRERFQPDLKPPALPKFAKKQHDSSDEDEDQGDYFEYMPHGEGTVRAASLASGTPKPASTPAARAEVNKSRARLGMTSMSTTHIPQPPPLSRQSTSRQRVGAGDLMSMTPGQDGSEESWYRPGRLGAVTPGLTRQDTAAWSSSLATSRAKRIKPEKLPSAEIQGGENNFNLRDAVMTSIAQSIGLLQPAGAATGGALSSMSVPGTPSVQAYRQNGSNKSPFGSLSMIDLLHVAQHTSALAVGDDESSVNGTTPESVMEGKNCNILEEIGDEIEILYFPAGTTLVKAGETGAGGFVAGSQRSETDVVAISDRPVLRH